MTLRRVLLAGCVAAGIVVLLAARCEPPPSVLLITIDTLRADAVGRGRDTPALDAFLAQARHFPGARSVAPLTLPAHASMLSGLLPAGHGLHDNSSPRLDDDCPTLARELKAAGYSTAAFIAHRVLRRETGLARGFETFASRSHGRLGAARLSRLARLVRLHGLAEDPQMLRILGPQ